MVVRYSSPYRYCQRAECIYSKPKVSRITTSTTAGQLTPANIKFLRSLGLKLKKSKQCMLKY